MGDERHNDRFNRFFCCNLQIQARRSDHTLAVCMKRFHSGNSRGLKSHRNLWYFLLPLSVFFNGVWQRTFRCITSTFWAGVWNICMIKRERKANMEEDQWRVLCLSTTMDAVMAEKAYIFFAARAGNILFLVITIQVPNIWWHFQVNALSLSLSPAVEGFCRGMFAIYVMRFRLNR